MTVEVEVEKWCRHIVQNNPPFKDLTIKWYAFGSAVLVMDESDSFDGVDRTHVHFDTSNIDLWRRNGVAIGESTTLQRLSVMYGYTRSHPINTNEARCLEELYEGIKQNTSVHTFKLTIHPANRVQMFDFAFFVEKNQNLQRVTFNSYSTLLPVQVTMISEAIVNTSLMLLDVCACPMENESYQQLISSCSRVQELHLDCLTEFRARVFADLLRTLNTKLKEIHISSLGTCYEGWTFKRDQRMTTIAASLRDNTTLTSMMFLSQWVNFEPLADLLCDTSSIDSVINSNHTLKKIGFSYGYSHCPPPHYIVEYTTLNRNSNNKYEAIRKKIARRYFIWDFSVTPFVKMPLSLLPRALELIDPWCIRRKEIINHQTAIFRMLRSIPSLCDVSSRKLKQEMGQRPRRSSRIKRLKSMH
jgi:hypothetical protein